jgi:serine/threonine protein kinase
MTDRDDTRDDRTVVAVEGGTGGSLPGHGWSTRRSASLAPGDVLNGIYRVNRFVARGGMGEVFEGINVESDERVAIKAIRSHLAQDIKVIAMFRKEARVLTQIAHPAIVQYRVLARDPVLELYYIVTDFIDGEPLTATLDGTHPPVGAIVTLARRLAAGLQAAHDHGAVHRDMSPDNVLLPDGRIERAKIIDFGIAKSLDVTAETVLGDGFAGKIGYVAPEQFGDYDRQVGPWTDVYSTALVLLAYARGKAPQMGTSLADAVERRRQRPDFEGVPPLLEPLFRQMLAPDPAERIRSMADVLAFLDGLALPDAAPEVDTAPPTAPPPAAPALPPGPETMFVPAPEPASGRATSASRPAAPPKRAAPPPKARRSKAKWGLAALPVVGVALWHFGQPSPPKPAPEPARIAPTPPKPGADAAPQMPAGRLLAGLAKAPCTWVSATDGGEGAPLILTGAAGERESFDQRAAGFAAQAGLASERLNTVNVMPLPPGRCALVDTLRPFDTPGAGDDRLGISASRIALGDARPACPGGAGAQLDIWVGELDPARDFALLALDPSGSVRQLVAGRDEFHKRSQQDAKAYYTDGNGRFHVAACFASTGTAGVLLVDRRGPLDLGLRTGVAAGEAGLPARFGALAASQGWRVRSEWVAVETALPGTPQKSATPSLSQTPVASQPVVTMAMPTPTPTPTADGPKGVADVRDLERNHQRQNSGAGACYAYRGSWTSLGYTSKSACVLSVFLNQCQVKSGQFDKTELRRAGGFIEERRGRKWRVILSDRRCG